MPGQGMQRMIQMLTSLAEMQDRRRKLALEEDTFEEQKVQFAQQMGFNEKDAKARVALKLIEDIGQGGLPAATAAPKLAQMLGFDEQESKVFSEAGPNASAALQLIQSQVQQFGLAQQQAGAASLAARGQLAPVQEQAYMGNQAGTNPGQMAMSGMTARLANTPLTADEAQRVGKGFVIRQATGQDPFAFAVGQAGLDKNMAPAAAGIQAGIDPSWANQAQDLYWRGILQNDKNGQNIRAQGGGMDASMYNSLINTGRSLLNDFAEGKLANKHLRRYKMEQYNTVAKMLGWTEMTEETAPDKTGVIRQGVNAVGGKNVPAYIPGKTDSTAQTTNPGGIYRPPNFF